MYGVYTRYLFFLPSFPVAGFFVLLPILNFIWFICGLSGMYA